MNRVILSGRLTKDVVLSDKGVAKFTVASQRSFKNNEGKYDADFVLCTAFGKCAEFISKYFSKGSQICVEGRINTGSFTNKDGQKVYTTDVAVEKAEFMGSKADNDSANGTQAPKQKEVAASPQSGADGFMNIPDSVDDIPFG